jgi:hypothetical protein
MSATLWNSASANAFSTTLNGSINDTVQTITLTSVTALPTNGGVIVLDRQDGSGNNTPTKREYVTYTSITGSNLTGCTRGVAGSTAQSHTSGSLVEETMSVTHWNDMVTFLQVEHDTTGHHVISNATISAARLITSLNASGASIVTSDLTVLRNLRLSGASINGNLPITPTWVIPGSLSTASTSVGKPSPMPQSGNWSFFNVMVRTPVSGSSLVIDVLKNGTSIFQTATKPSILGGGTFISTASINTKSFNPGDAISVDLSNGGGTAKDMTVTGRAY